MDSAKRFPLWLAILFGAVPTLGFWLSGLFDLDEGYYAAVVGEMNRRHEWITPYYNGHPWFEKPILLYWLAKPCVMLFGEAGARLPSAFCLLGTCAVVASFAKRFGERAAVLAPMVMGGMLIPAAVGRLMMTDMPLVLALSGALVLTWQAAESRSLVLWAAAGACAGIGVLAKGPVALILFAPAGIFAARRHSKSLGPLGLAAFGLATVAVAATWYVPAYLANGQVFVQKFLIEQNFGRFAGGDEAHTLGVRYIWLYLPIAILGSLPFTPWALRVWRGGDERHAFLRWWALWTLGFFSISGAKLPHYILPMFPPLAILVADRLAEMRSDPRWLAGWCAALAVLLTAGSNWWYAKSGQAEAHATIRNVRGDPDLVLYQLSRRKREKGTGKPKIQETSLPSLFFVADRAVPDLEDLTPLFSKKRLEVFTRVGRIGPKEEGEIESKFGFRVMNRRVGKFYETIELSR